MVMTKKPPASRNTTGVSPSASSATTPERVEDRRDDRAEGDREQRGLAQAAGEPRLGPPRAAGDAARPPARALPQPSRARPARSERRPPSGRAHGPSPPGARGACQPEPAAADQREQRAEHHAQRQRPAAARERRDHHGHAQERASARRGRGWRRRGRAARRHRSPAQARLPVALARLPFVDSMITRHGPLGQDRLQRPAEQRHSRAPRRQRHHHRAGADLPRLLHDPPPGLARPDLLPVARHAPPAADPGGVDDRRRAGLLVGQVRVDRRVRRAP